MAEIELWVIMDKSKKAIACGSPRNRSMRLLSEIEKNTSRILLYGTEGRARAGFSGGMGFFDETYNTGKNPHPTYLRKTYGDFKDYEEICIPVRVRMVIDD